jgi:hypothetical protein
MLSSRSRFDRPGLLTSGSGFLMTITRPEAAHESGMLHQLHVPIAAQPDLLTCGPTCLHAIYQYFGDTISLEQVIEEIHMLEAGGTLDVFLANHALRRGYRAKILTYNLQIFDPTWFGASAEAMKSRLERQAEVKADAKLRYATAGYLEFLELGGRVEFEILTASLIRRYLRRGKPLLTGLNATYLYGSMREEPNTMIEDDIHGEPVGHFVVLSGYNRQTREVQVADPYRANPYSETGSYSVDMRRLIGAVLLGVLTYDANLLLIQPARSHV